MAEQEMQNAELNEESLVDPEAIIGSNDDATEPEPEAMNHKNKTVIGVAVAVVAVALVVVLVRLFACSAVANPNMVDLVTKSSDEAASILKGQKEAEVQGLKVYTNNEDFVSAFEKSLQGEQMDAKKYVDSYLLLVGEGSVIVGLDDIANGANPTQAELVLMLRGGSLTAEGVANRVAEFAPYEHVYAVALPDVEGYYSGAAVGNGCATTFTATLSDDVWLLALKVVSIDEDEMGQSESDNFERTFESINPEHYADCYKE